MRLITNNPLKIQALQEQGITVERVPLTVGLNPFNEEYLQTKHERMAHWFMIKVTLSHLNLCAN